jgi:hypothetical protein
MLMKYYGGVGLGNDYVIFFNILHDLNKKNSSPQARKKKLSLFWSFPLREFYYCAYFCSVFHIFTQKFSSYTLLSIFFPKFISDILYFEGQFFFISVKKIVLQNTKYPIWISGKKLIKVCKRKIFVWKCGIRNKSRRNNKIPLTEMIKRDSIFFFAPAAKNFFCWDHEEY